MSSAIPIRNGGDQSIPLHFHRDSFAHSQGMGGISWGGASVGSWLRDEVLMATKDNKEVANNFGSVFTGSVLGDSIDQTSYAHNDPALGSMGMSPDHHPNYFPSLEANFCKDYSCCGNILPTLHDLLRHYEEQHVSPSPPEEPPVMRRMQNIETVSTNDVFLPFDQPHDHSHDGLSHRNNGGANSNIFNGAGASLSNNNNGGANGGAGGDMLDNSGMDYDGFGLGGTNAQPNSQQAFAPPSFQPLNQGMNNMNTFSSNQANNRSKRNGSAGNVLNGGVNAAQLNRSAAGAATNTARLALGDEEEPTIDDPARQLYMLERSENKPFKCPVIGCEKTYKNQNGLKYHRQHGHQNQKLKANPDGTFSIIDPVSNTPYPDGMGMEKDKPYRCEICGKRYKNLNGLKYHRAHSTH